MTISKQILQQLRGRGHTLKPVVMIGHAGVTEAVLKEIDNALSTHELIKIKLAGIGRDARPDAITQICETLHCDLIDAIGQVAVCYRPKPE